MLECLSHHLREWKRKEVKEEGRRKGGEGVNRGREVAGVCWLGSVIYYSITPPSAAVFLSFTATFDKWPPGWFQFQFARENVPLIRVHLLLLLQSLLFLIALTVFFLLHYHSYNTKITTIKVRTLLIPYLTNFCVNSRFPFFTQTLFVFVRIWMPTVQECVVILCDHWFCFLDNRETMRHYIPT